MNLRDKIRQVESGEEPKERRRKNPRLRFATLPLDLIDDHPPLTLDNLAGYTRPPSARNGQRAAEPGDESGGEPKPAQAKRRTLAQLHEKAGHERESGA